MLTTLAFAGDNPVNHVVNTGFWSKDLFGMHGVWLWSSHVGTLLLAGLLTFLVLWWAAGKIATGRAVGGLRAVRDAQPVCARDRGDLHLPA